ncbi:hypothetical protein ACSSS7_004485 [Eimeria intestinalis]
MKLQKIYRSLKIDLNASSPGFHGRFLDGLLDEALRIEEERSAQAEEILNACKTQPHQESAASAGSAAAAKRLKADAALDAAPAAAALAPGSVSRPRALPPLKAEPAGAAGEAAAATAAAAGGNASAAAAAGEPAAAAAAGARPTAAAASEGGEAASSGTSWDRIPRLQGKVLTSIPRFLCSNATLVICPPFLARHWEAQIDQWFGWFHLPPDQRIKVLVFERPSDLAAASRFDVAASDVVVVTTNVLTREFSRCLANPFEAPDQQQQQRQQQQRKRRSGDEVSAAEAEARFWQQHICSSSSSSSSRSSRSVLQRLAGVLPADQQQRMLSSMRSRLQQQQPRMHFAAGAASAAAAAAAAPRGSSPYLCAKSPLLGIHFFRIAVDEGHRLVHNNSLHVQLAYSLRADRR